MKQQPSKELTATDYYSKSLRNTKWAAGLWLSATLMTGTTAYHFNDQGNHIVDMAQQYSADGDQQAAEELNVEAANSEVSRNIFLGLTALDLSVTAMNVIGITAMANARRHSE